MARRLTFLLTLAAAFSLTVGVCFAASPHEADQKTLLAGVSVIAAPGLPGPISVFGPEAFPLVVGQAGENLTAPVVAAAQLGAGPVVAFSAPRRRQNRQAMTVERERKRKRTKMKIVNVGVIGCGSMAMHLLRRCVALERGRITAIYDPSPEAQATALRELDAVSTPDIGTLLNRPDVDAILIGSPPSLHREHVLMAAAAGKPIYCEKPLSITTADCDEMISACQAARVPLFVGQVLRLFPLFWKSRLLIEEGKIGTPRALSVTRAGYHTMFHSGWRTERAKAGGLLLETNVHEFDYARFILGEPVEVYARLDNLYGDFDYEDQAFALITFAGGATASLHASLSSPLGKYQVEIQGTGGNMTHGGFKGPLQYQAPGGPVHEVQLEEVGTLDPYDWELTSWLDSLTAGSAPLFTGADGRVAVAMAEAAMLSAEENRPVRLSELLAKRHPYGDEYENRDQSLDDAAGMDAGSLFRRSKKGRVRQH